MLKITEDTAGKASFQNYVRDENGVMRRMTDAEYEAKLNAEAHIDELAQISERINKNREKMKPQETVNQFTESLRGTDGFTGKHGFRTSMGHTIR